MAQTQTNINTALAVPTIRVTTDYDQFDIITGNRKVKQGHVAELTKVILRHNLLAQNPIIVNRKMQVLDGQHRLEVAKNNNLPIYYVVSDEGKLEDVQMLNSTAKAWNGYDYLQSYVDQGKPVYLKLKEYVDKGIIVSNAIRILAGVDAKNLKAGGRQWTAFKRGELQVRDEAASDMFVEAYLALKPYVYQRAWNDREFVGALKKVLTVISAEELIVKLDEFGEKLDAQVSTRDYLRRFEEIINYRQRKDFVRLF